MWSVLVVVLLLFLIFMGVPIAISVGLVTILVLLVKGSIPFTAIPQYLYESSAIYGFLAAPLFILVACPTIQEIRKFGSSEKV